MKSKTLKLSVLILSLIAISCFALACTTPNPNQGQTPPAHTHEYGDTYTYDDNYHWYECECGEDKGRAPHILVDNKCVCGYVKKGEEQTPDTPIHTHIFDRIIVNDDYLKSKATCEKSAVYYYSCACGEKSEQTFENGKELGHNYGEWVSNGDDTHTKTCSRDSSHKITENCLGGEATCTKKAVCEVCGEGYGLFVNHKYVSGACKWCNASEGLHYTLINDAEYEVAIVGTCIANDIVIPSIYNGKPVTSIGYEAFYYCSSLTSVVIGDSVTSIDNYAFEGCSLLKSVEIPDSVTSIGYHAFYSCTSLTSITVANNNQNYKSIDGNLYSKDGKTLIQYAAGKTETSFIIPDSVTSIGSDAFAYCSSLTSVVIGDSVTSIDNYAFYRCSSLTSITVANNNQNYKSIDGNLYSKDGKTLIQYAPGKTETSFIIPDSVTSIGYHAFEYCDSLTSVVIGDSVTSIDNYAFHRCSSLTSVTFSDTTTWYRVTSYSAWENKTGGTSTSVTNPTDNAYYLRARYDDYYWYKI